MKLWVDADAAPRDVKEIVFRTARRLEIPAVLVANQWISTPLDHPFVTAVRVAGGPDVADRHIAEHAEPGDVAVTADIPLAARLVEKKVTGERGGVAVRAATPLAARLVEKKVTVIDPRGEEYDEENVGERLAVRDFMDGLRGAGIETSGPRPYSPKDRQAFAAALDRVLSRALRRRPSS